MAVPGDFAYLRHLIDEALVKGPVLEIGSRAWQGEQGNARRECERAGLAWEGADVVDGPGVDFQLDVLDVASVAAVGRQWPTVLVFNLLEHVYDPIRALENAMTLVAPGGISVVVGPAVWQLHDFPRDYWRPMPDFFLEFARRHGFEVVEDELMWIVRDRLLAVSDFTRDGQKKLPSTSRPGVVRVWGRPRAYWGRAVHLLLATFGRETPYPDCGLAVLMRKPPVA